MPTVKAAVRGDALVPIGESLRLYWPNLLFLQNYVGSNPAGPTWTLAVEEHFYVMLPLLLLFLAATGRTRWLLFLALGTAPLCLLLRCLSAAMKDPFATGMIATHLRLDALFLGVAIRAAAQYWPEHFSASRRWRWALFLVGIVLWIPNLFVEAHTALIRTVGLTATYVGSGAFLLAAYHTHAADFGRLMTRPVRRVASFAAWIGVYSYAIYLWHVSVIGISEGPRGVKLLALGGSWVGSTWFVLTLGICAACVLAGVVTSKLIEWPVLRFRDTFFPTRSRSLPASLARPGAAS